MKNREYFDMFVVGIIVIIFLFILLTIFCALFHPFGFDPPIWATMVAVYLFIAGLVN